MKNLSPEFRRALYNQERNYLVYADITLSNNTVLNLTNSDIWTGGFTYEETVSEDEQFTALGSVIIGSAQLIINNIYETYSDYDFTNAKVVMYLGMQFTNRLEKFKIGTYTVDETNYNGATIRLSLLDNIMYLDKPYSISTLRYPTTLDAIVRDICTKCVVTLSADSYQFPNRNFTVDARPNDESITCREVLSWAATIAGCYVKCNPDGEIELKWFDTAALENAEAELDGGSFNPWTSGDIYDGGTFNPWSTGTEYDGGSLEDARNVNYISNLYSQNIGMDDVVITGVIINVKDESSSSTKDIQSYTAGTSGYVILVEDNKFITTANANAVVSYLGNQLIGLRFRKLNISQANDPAIESGDVGLVIDRKQHVYRALITRVSFSVDAPQTIVCGASTPTRNSATRYSAATKSYVEARKLLRQERSAYDAAIADLSQRLAENTGFYTTIVHPSTGGDICYMHDQPNLANSKKVWKMTASAWAATTDWRGTDSATTAAEAWNIGMTVDGQTITRILSAVGVNATWINTGTLDANKITVNNLSADVIQTGTMSADRIEGGTLSLGGSNGQLGILEILNAGGTRLVYSDVEGYKVINGGIFASLTEDAFTNDQDVGVLRNSALEFGWLSSGTSINNANFHTNGKMRLIRDDNSITQSADVTRIDLSFNRPESQMMTLGYYDNNGTPVPMVILQTLSDSYSQEDQRYPIYDTKSGTAIAHYTPIVMTRNTGIDGALHVKGNFYVYGNDKNRVIETPDYGTRLQYAYETASPYFGDIGTAETDNYGRCYVFLDDILRETINQNYEYSVFLQKEGEGDIWIKEKTINYFVVQGTPNLSFSWELKARQIDHTDTRLELLPNEEPDDIDYAAEGALLVEEYLNIAEVYNE